MVEGMALLEKVALWEGMGPRHRNMVRAIATRADGLGLDAPSWDAYLEEVAATAAYVKAKEPLDLAPLQELIERGYRRVMFRMSPEIQALEEEDGLMMPHDREALEARRRES